MSGALVVFQGCRSRSLSQAHIAVVTARGNHPQDGHIGRGRCRGTGSAAACETGLGYHDISATWPRGIPRVLSYPSVPLGYVVY